MVKSVNCTKPVFKLFTTQIFVRESNRVKKGELSNELHQKTTILLRFMIFNCKTAKRYDADPSIRNKC